MMQKLPKRTAHAALVGCALTLLPNAAFAKTVKTNPPAKTSRQKLPKRTAETSSPTYGPWRSCLIGGGGYLQNVVPCPSNPKRYYTYIDVGGLARSDDGGHAWRMLHGSLPAKEANYQVRGLVVDPRDDRKVVIATGSQWSGDGGLYASDDAGQTWRKAQDAQFMGNGPERWTGFILARHPQNPDVIMAASEGTGVWRSADNGRTWRTLGMTGLHPTDIKFDKTNPQRLWLCTQPFSGWLGGKQATLTGGFYRSEDGGQNWAKLADASPSEVLQDTTDPARLIGSVGGAVQSSHDAGATWQPFGDGLPPRTSKTGPADDEFNALAAGPDFALTASAKGTFYKLPAGQTRWRKIDRQGVEEVYQGQEWFRHRSGGMGSALASITIDPRDPNHWFFTDWFAIYQTPDAGRHWRLCIDGIEDTVLHAITQDPTDSAVVHLGMADDGYFVSEDGGRRFAGNKDGISNNVKCIALAPNMPGRIYAVGPKTWEWEANQVFVSIDRGEHWTRSPMQGLPDKGNCNTIAVDPQDPYTVYLAVSGPVGPNGGGLYRSTDGGRKWASMSQGLPTGAEFYRDSIWGGGPEVAVSPNGTAVTIGSKAGQVFRLDSLSRQWVKVGLPVKDSLSEVVADGQHPGRFYLSMNGGGLFRSDDDGQTWAQVSTERVAHVAVDGAVPNRIAIGTADGVQLSADAGQTWTPLDKRLPFRTGDLVAFAGHRLLVGTAGSGAFWMPLDAAGLKTVEARPAHVSAPAATQGELPKLTNLDMSRGTVQPTGWGTWVPQGRLELTRDTENFHDGPASLQINTDGAYAEGAVSQGFPAVTAPFHLSGWTRARGDLKECLVAVQVWNAQGKQIDWINLDSVSPGGDWHKFTKTVQLPAQAARCSLIMTLHGTGQAWLDGLALSAPPSVFREQAP